MEPEAIKVDKIYASPGYDCLSQIRADISDFVCICAAPAELGGRLQLSATEIVSNLLQHPKRRPETIRLYLERHGDVLRMDIADDSSPFEKFDEHAAKSRLRHLAEPLRESGYGLGFVLQQHGDVNYDTQERSDDNLNHFTVIESLPSGEKKPHVFLVDDDPFYHSFIKAALEPRFRVSAFGGARQALDAFETLKPDIVVSDLQMPEMDGLELRRALSLLPDGDMTPFVFLSGHREIQYDPCLNRLGIDDFICKPVSEDRLFSVLDRLLHRSRQLRTQIEGRVGASITELMQPSLPSRLGGWNAHVRSLAAETGGGDFLMHNRDGNASLVVLTDVMGHGLEAKFFAYAYAGYLRSLFKSRGGVDPVPFLSCLSQEVAEDKLLESTLITCLAVRLQDDGRVIAASAGHPQPVVTGRNGTRKIDVSGPLPGLAGDAVYHEASLRLEKRERIFFFTDGFLAAFGSARATPEKAYAVLLPLAEKSADMSAEDALAYLWGAFAQGQNANTANKDDATLVLLERGD